MFGLQHTPCFREHNLPRPLSSASSLHFNKGNWRRNSVADTASENARKCIARTSYINICSATVAHSQDGEGGSHHPRIQTLNKYFCPGCLKRSIFHGIFFFFFATEVLNKHFKLMPENPKQNSLYMVYPQFLLNVNIFLSH